MSLLNEALASVRLRSTQSVVSFSPTLHQDEGVRIITPHFYNKSTLYKNCNVQVLENTETEDISIGFFKVIEK